MKAFTIEDRKAEGSMFPFPAETSGLALRQFEQKSMDPSHPFHQYPSDFTLYEIGTWDPKRRKFIALEDEINHGTAEQFAHRSREETHVEEVRS